MLICNVSEMATMTKRNFNLYLDVIDKIKPYFTRTERDRISERLKDIHELISTANQHDHLLLIDQCQALVEAYEFFDRGNWARCKKALTTFFEGEDNTSMWELRPSSWSLNHLRRWFKMMLVTKMGVSQNEVSPARVFYLLIQEQLFKRGGISELIRR